MNTFGRRVVSRFFALVLCSPHHTRTCSLPVTPPWKLASSMIASTWKSGTFITCTGIWTFRVGREKKKKKEPVHPGRHRSDQVHSWRSENARTELAFAHTSWTSGRVGRQRSSPRSPATASHDRPRVDAFISALSLPRIEDIVHTVQRLYHFPSKMYRI